MVAKYIILATTSLLPLTGTWGSIPDLPLSNYELKIGAGHYTAGGKYLGGRPEFDNELERYDCKEFNTNGSSACYDAPGVNATVCMPWTADEISSDEYEVGSCTCSAITNAKYCAAWTCTRTEKDRKAVCGNGRCYRDLEVETTLCICDTEDDTAGKFCASWTCVETSDGDEHPEYEDYQCVRPSESGEYCATWTGLSESFEEVEASACECLQELGNGGVCRYWESKERGLTMCSLGTWCDMGMSLGVGGFFGSWGAMFASQSLYTDNPKDSFRDIYAGSYTGPYLFCGSVWVAGWSGLVVVWGGQDGAVYAGIWWATIIAGGLLYRCMLLYCDCRPVKTSVVPDHAPDVASKADTAVSDEETKVSSPVVPIHAADGCDNALEEQPT